MLSLRALILSHRSMAAVLLLFALIVRLVVPAGFMLSASKDLVLTVTICSGGATGAAQMAMTIPIDKSGDDHSGNQVKNHPCAFTSLGDQAIGGAPDFIIAAALAYILVLGLAPVARPVLPRVAYLRPPLRGPPALL